MAIRLRLRRPLVACLLAILAWILAAQLTVAQSAGPSPLNPLQIPSPTQLFQLSGEKPILATSTVRWITLDGRRLFQITGTATNIEERAQQVQTKLRAITRHYLSSENAEPQVEIREINRLPVLYVNDQYLLTVTDLDADLRNIDPLEWARQLQRLLTEALVRARQERQPEFLIRQGGITLAIILSGLLVTWQLSRLQYRIRRALAIHQAQLSDSVKAHRTQLNRQQAKQVQNQLIQAFKIGLWTISLFLVLHLFPYTRPGLLWLIDGSRLPLILVLTGIGAYLLVRLSYLVINRFTLTLSDSLALTPVKTQRLQLRISTISAVIKSLTAIAWAAIGVVVALILLGVDIGPLVAGIGLIGVALSLASQSIIKDMINGFLIVLEDQYGIGDMVRIGSNSGIVEALNLRITQIRNTEGDLITIPNSEVKTVANLSNNWSRVNLDVPVSYDADVDWVIDLIEKTAFELGHDSIWQAKILEPPQIMGIDDFGERGLMVKVWIKTQPLEQWAVAREYRRRLKRAFDQAGVNIPVHQQSLWINESLPDHPSEPSEPPS